MTPSQQVDKHIAAIADWRGKVFAAIRKAVLAADRGIVEEYKWRGTPLWSLDGMIAVCNAFKGRVKVTFAYGARLADPDEVFNDDFNGNTRRAINYFEGDKVDERALKALVRAAIEHNRTKLKKNVAPKRKGALPKKSAPKKKAAKKKRT
jgi:hypothetical protein